MFKIFKKKDVDPSLLETVLTEALEELQSLSPSDPEYARVLVSVKELHALKMAEKPKTKMSPDAVANIAANLLGIGMIMSFEKVNVITSKAFGMITKPKI